MTDSTDGAQEATPLTALEDLFADYTDTLLTIEMDHSLDFAKVEVLTRAKAAELGVDWDRACLPVIDVYRQPFLNSGYDPPERATEEQIASGLAGVVTWSPPAATREGPSSDGGQLTITMQHRDGVGEGDPLWAALVTGVVGGDGVTGRAFGNTVGDALASATKLISAHLKPAGRDVEADLAATERVRIIEPGLGQVVDPTVQGALTSELEDHVVIPLPKKIPGYGRLMRFERMRATGVLWLINTTVFHPRGWAIGLCYPEDADPADVAAGKVEPAGWTIYGDGTEAWRMSQELTDRCFENWSEFEAVLRQVTGETELVLERVDTEEPRP